MPVDQAHSAIERWVAGLNGGDIDAAIGVLAPEYRGHLTGMPVAVEGPEGFKATYTQFIRPAFPDQKIVIQKMISHGDRVAVQIEWTATHTGPFMNIPATGRQVRVAGTGIFLVRKGKIVEEWLQEDMLGLFQQLQPAPQAAAS